MVSDHIQKINNNPNSCLFFFEPLKIKYKRHIIIVASSHLLGGSIYCALAFPPNTIWTNTGLSGHSYITIFVWHIRHWCGTKSFPPSLLPSISMMSLSKCFTTIAFYKLLPFVMSSEEPSSFVVSFLVST